MLYKFLYSIQLKVENIPLPRMKAKILYFLSIKYKVLKTKQISLSKASQSMSYPDYHYSYLELHIIQSHKPVKHFKLIF